MMIRLLALLSLVSTAAIAPSLGGGRSGGFQPTASSSMRARFAQARHQSYALQASLKSCLVELITAPLSHPDPRMQAPMLAPMPSYMPPPPKFNAEPHVQEIQKATKRITLPRQNVVERQQLSSEQKASADRWLQQYQRTRHLTIPASAQIKNDASTDAPVPTHPTPRPTTRPATRPVMRHTPSPNVRPTARPQATPTSTPMTMGKPRSRSVTEHLAKPKHQGERPPIYVTHPGQAAVNPVMMAPEPEPEPEPEPMLVRLELPKSKAAVQRASYMDQGLCKAAREKREVEDLRSFVASFPGWTPPSLQ